MSLHSKQIVFALHICFAVLAGTLFVIDMIAAEAYLVGHYGVALNSETSPWPP